MSGISRRNMLKAGTLLSAGASGLGGTTGTARAADPAGGRYNWGHTVEFARQYYETMSAILAEMRRTEMDLFGDITSRMAETLKKGGRVWLQNSAGHMATKTILKDSPGNPGLLEGNGAWGGGDYEQMQSGDVLMTNWVSGKVREVRDKGVYVIGVQVNYVDNEWSPRGFVYPNDNDWLLGDTSNVILDQHVPYYQGIVDCPQIPEMRICPSAGVAQCTTQWMVQAEVANKMHTKNAPHIDKSAAFIDTILERIGEAYRLQSARIFDHAPDIARRIMNGGHFHVTSDPDGVRSEATVIAMGPRMTNAFRDDMKKGDVHLLATVEPDSAMILDEAIKSRDMGMYTVIIGPGNAHGLRRYADLFIDNLSPEGTGLFTIEGFDHGIATAGEILNNFLMWILTAQFVDEMVRRGGIPWFYIGYYQVGGREYADATKQFFERQGF